MRSFKRLVVCLLFFVPFAFAFVGCHTKVRKRPPGYLKIGPVKDYLAKNEYFLYDKRLMLRRDSRGFYVMSTLCTYDTSALVEKPLPGGGYKLVSVFEGSEYDRNGKVIKGPAVADLPYYKLEIAPEVYGGPPDTLYVKIGEEVSPDWRLPVPPLS